MTAIDVAVVGGGASGLAAAYELHRQGVRFALLDAAPQLGGVIRTDHVDGFTLDAGPDSFLTQKPAAVQLCEELDLGNRLISTLEPRTAYVLRGQFLSRQCWEFRRPCSHGSPAPCSLPRPNSVWLARSFCRSAMQTANP